MVNAAIPSSGRDSGVKLRNAYIYFVIYVIY